MAKLVIMQGIPGSGKGFVNKRDYPSALVCSADDYFRTRNPNYDNGGEGFDPSHLGKAHKQCQDRVRMAMECGEPIVVVDNTNLDDKSIKTYVKLARTFGYDIEICRVECDITVAAARNSHGVPEFVYERMGKAFDKWKLTDKFSDVTLRIVDNNPVEA
jgi:predicted kinase